MVRAMGTYRPEFVEALRLLAEAFADVVKAGYGRPVIVGGAAVEFYTGGAVVSGDFDVVTAAQVELENALIARGFQRPSGPGMLLRGVLHPRLGIGVEVVSGYLFDGATDKARIRVVSVSPGEVNLPPVEDMIADRLGQFAGSNKRDREMLDQAAVLYQIARYDLDHPLDEAYLDTRIKHESSGVCDLRFLIEKANETDDA